ncbi:MAG TPA: glycosyltransferase family 2 protein [Conexibacter sp.]|nr:glycosyltransferase family 2 protein [Conexibacter sp.]
MTASWWIVVLSWNGREDTLACLASLRALGSADVAVACVDNGSMDGSVAAVREAFPEVTLIENGRNLGFAGGNNVGIAHALAHGAEWVALVNNDATLAPEAIERLRAAAVRHPDAGVLAGKVLFADGGASERVWFAGQRVSLTLGYSGRPRGHGRPDGPAYREERETGRAVGAFMAVSRAALDAVGMLDDELFLYVEDVDWCVRIRRAGFAVWFVPDAVARHRVSAASGGEGASPTALYYGVRNTVVVCERHRPLPRGLAGLRRTSILATFALHALRSPHRRVLLRAVCVGYRDARAGLLGERRAPQPPSRDGAASRRS